MTPRQRQRIDALRNYVDTASELAQALLEQLRELCADDAGHPVTARDLAVLDAARAHAAALVELLPLFEDDPPGRCP